jgi:hypothetical protein
MAAASAGRGELKGDGANKPHPFLLPFLLLLLFFFFFFFFFFVFAFPLATNFHVSYGVAWRGLGIKPPPSTSHVSSYGL